MICRHPPRPRPTSRVLCALAGFLVMASPSAAATRIWIGGGGNTLWSTPGNWIGGLVPASGDLVAISSAATTGVGSNDIASLSLAGLIIDHAYTLTGLQIHIGAGGLNVSSLNVVITMPIRLSAHQAWGTTVAIANVNSAIGLNGYTLTFNVNGNNELRLGGVVTGSGALVKNGDGVVRLAGSNTYLGTTTVNNGYLLVAHENALGQADGSVENGTIVHGDSSMAGSIQIASVNVGNEYLSVEGLGHNGNGALQGSGTALFAGRLVAASTIGINVSGANRLTLAGPVSGPGRLVLINGGIFVFSNASNTYSGGLGIGEGGNHESRVTIIANEGIPHAPVQAVPALSTLTIDGVRQTLAGVTGAGLLRLTNAQSELVVNGSGSTTFNGTLSGSGLVRHVGIGSQHFNGDAASMSGQVIVDQGTVTIATTMPADMTANVNGTLVLSGTPSVGDIIVHDGRLLLAAPNAVVANATATHLALTPGGGLNIDGGSGNQFGRLNVQGQVSLDGTLGVAPSATLDAPVNTVFTLIANDGTDPIAGTFANLPQGATVMTPLARFQIAYDGGDGNDVTLTLVGFGRDYLLSEGAIGPFFTTEILIANPNDGPAPIRVSFLKPGGGAVEFDDEVAPLSRKTIVANDVAALDVTEFSTVVRSLAGWPLVVERTMTWDRQSAYGAHTERAADAPSTTWYFAEGSQGFFSTFLLLANPNDAATVATVQYLIEDGPPVTRTYDVAALSRRTIDAGADPALVNRSFGMVVTFTQPGLAERAMYFGSDPLWGGGHASAGVKAPSVSAFVAEGATGPFFETYVLIANPNSTAVDVTLTFGRQGDTLIQMTRTVAASSRLTLNLETLDPGLANVPVSTRVEASQPVIVERAQYWPDPAPQWYEAHSSPALQTIGTKWGLAEGRVGGPASYQTYILLANTQATDAHVSIAFLRENGPSFTKTFTVPATQRLNVPVGPGTDVPELVDERFGALITSDQPIAVERAMYANAGGQTWAAGTSANATPVP